jgi:hypothetical protein
MHLPLGANETCKGASDLPVLVHDVGVLLRHLTRNAPGALQRAFAAAAKNDEQAKPPPAGPDGAAANPADFLQAYADIAAHWATRPVHEGATEVGRSAAHDWSWLVQARAFLTQHTPVPLDSVLVTEALHCELARLSARPGRLRRLWSWLAAGRARWQRNAPPAAAVVDQVAVVAGRELATHVRRVRLWTVVVTVVAVLASMYVFAGKTLLDDQRRQEAQLAAVSADIQRDLDLRRAAPPEGGFVNAIKSGTVIHDTTLHYCDQPFLDHNGVVRFASATQAQNCNRLWGTNQAVNQTTRAMRNWMVPVPDLLAWIIGAGGANGAGPDSGGGRSGWLRRAWTSAFGTENGHGTVRVSVRVFRENARGMSVAESLILATREVCNEAEVSTLFAVAATRAPDAQALPPPPAAVRAGTQNPTPPPAAVTHPAAQDDAPPTAAVVKPPAGAPPNEAQRARQTAAQPAMPPCGKAAMDAIRDRAAAIHFRARTSFSRLGFAEAGYITGDDGYSPTRARILIESASLYLLPVIFALLGSLVALNRALRIRIEGVRLGLSERARGNTSLVLGTAFGAIVSLIAEVLRSGYALPGGTAPSATGVALGLWPLAFLAGYSVTHVFRMLDSAVDRVFGQADSPSRN